MAYPTTYSALKWVPLTGVSFKPEELQAHVASQIAAFKVPVRIEQHHEPLPRNANGKIMRPAVKDLMGIGKA